MEIPPQVQAQLMQFQQFQQQLQMIILQKQGVEAELNETKKALEELEKSSAEEVYKLVGGLFVKRKKDEVINELKEKLETLELRLKTLQKQEDKLKEKLEEIQKKLQSVIPAAQ
ncbi:prefoldin subunit beta [Methanocaldococcus infernus]|uniref:Prefoldin subunit beta n=1 Tax=Methanocaldococcus infernus (strain DSM 11812 / JCM 15783 / ME) TaxID=573063 RepID=D5VTG5_METIM|nr:prefoldin subunit beta [Methanocaldococcus infernus]ADG13868.1 prefoldin, beta subunit [Methanocaldococcus infernus ME]